MFLMFLMFLSLLKLSVLWVGRVEGEGGWQLLKMALSIVSSGDRREEGRGGESGSEPPWNPKVCIPVAPRPLVCRHACCAQSL